MVTVKIITNNDRVVQHNVGIISIKSPINKHLLNFSEYTTSTFEADTATNKAAYIKTCWAGH